MMLGTYEEKHREMGSFPIRENFLCYEEKHREMGSFPHKGNCLKLIVGILMEDIFPYGKGAHLLVFLLIGTQHHELLWRHRAPG